MNRNIIAVSEKGSSPPENIYALGRMGLNISQLSGQGDGFGVSPELALGAEYLANHYFAVDLYLGYLQARLPVSTGLIKADFFKSSLYFVGRYPLKMAIPYIFLGGYANIHFSSEFADNATGEIYDMAENFNPANFGLSFGAGVQMHLWLVDVFADAVYSWGLNNSIKKVQSSVINLEPAPDFSVQIYLGAKYALLKV